MNVQGWRYSSRVLNWCLPTKRWFYSGSQIDAKNGWCQKWMKSVKRKKALKINLSFPTICQYFTVQDTDVQNVSENNVTSDKMTFTHQSKKNFRPASTMNLFLYVVLHFHTTLHMVPYLARPTERHCPKNDMLLALFGIFLVRYGNWFSRPEQVENAPKFPQPSEGGNQFANGFRNLTNHLQFLSCSYIFIYFWHFSFSNEKWFRKLLMNSRWQLCNTHWSYFDRTCWAWIHGDSYVTPTVHLLWL